MQEENKIFVGNLPFGTTQEALQAAFSQFGEITDCYVPKDRESGRLKPFGFVTFQDAAGAAAAIEGMNGKPLADDEQARPLTVNLARPKEERPAGSFGGNRGGGYRGGNGGGNGGYRGNNGGGNWRDQGANRGNDSYGNDSQE